MSLLLLFEQPQRFSFSLSESASAADHPTVSLQFSLSLAEAANAVDHPTITAQFKPSLAESAHAVDSPSVGPSIFHVSLSETAQAVDAPILVPSGRSIPSLPSGQLIDYIFNFSSLSAAMTDATVGPYFVPFSGLSNDILLFGDKVPSGYFVMISKMSPVDPNLFNHMDLSLVINRTTQIQGQPSVLFTTFTVPGNLTILVNGLGTHTTSGLH